MSFGKRGPVPGSEEWKKAEAKKTADQQKLAKKEVKKEAASGKKEARKSSRKEGDAILAQQKLHAGGAFSMRQAKDMKRKLERPR
jgi:hypothetical protein